MPRVLRPSPGQRGGGAGLQAIRQFDERIGLRRGARITG
jgi:hypothetical protein